MKQITTENGQAEVIFNVAPMKDVMALKKALLEQFQQYNVGFKVDMKDLQSALNSEIDGTKVLDFIKNVLIGMDISDSVIKALEKCLMLCTYEGMAIKPQLWDDQNGLGDRLRSDYYEVIGGCIEHNLHPFIQSLCSMFKTGKLMTVLNQISGLNANGKSS